MKLAIVSTICLLGSAIAAPATLEERDLSIITYNVNRVNQVMKVLDNNLKKKPRDALSAQSYFSQCISLNNNLVQ